MPLTFRFYFLVIVVIIFSSCEPDYFFHKKYTFDSSGWAHSDSLIFSVPITDTLRIYNLFLEVEHTDAYAYQNMYVRIHTTFPNQQRLTERLSVNLAAKNGVWNGECSGQDCQLQVGIQEGAFFNQPGDYTFVFEQFMRHDTLNKITAIAFNIEDTGEVRGEKVPE